MFRWLDIFVPDRFRPIDDRILSDSYSQSLIKETEHVLDKLIEQSNKYNANRTIRKRQLEYKILIKIKKKKISVVFQDTHLSKSNIKKKIYLQCYRKYFKSHKGLGKWIESTIHYVEDGKTYVRSVRKSAMLQAIFFKVDRLDDALMGQLISENVDTAQAKVNIPIQEKELEVKQIFLETKRILTHKDSWSLDPLIENRLQRILQEADKLLPDFSLLDIEERYTVKRMLGEDIPNLLHTYLSLTPEHQLKQKENIFVTLSRMELTLIDLTSKLENARLEKMEHLIKINEKRY